VEFPNINFIMKDFVIKNFINTMFAIMKFFDQDSDPK